MHANLIIGNSKKCSTVINCGSSQHLSVVHHVMYPHNHRRNGPIVCFKNRQRNKAESHNSVYCHNPELNHTSLASNY